MERLVGFGQEASISEVSENVDSKGFEFKGKQINSSIKSSFWKSFLGLGKSIYTSPIKTLKARKRKKSVDILNYYEPGELLRSIK